MKGSPAQATLPGTLVRPPVTPRVFTLKHSAAFDGSGYPIFTRRWEAQGETPLHEHLFYEIVVVESGTVEHFSAEGVRKLHVGDLIVIKPHIWHQYKNPRNFGIVNCLFDRRILMNQKTFFSLVESAFELFVRPAGPSAMVPPVFLHASPAQRERINQIVNDLLRERREKLIDWEAALLVHLQDLIILISRLYHGIFPQEERSLSDETRDFCNEIVMYLESRFREKISLADLSKKFHVSASYLSRVFKRRMGMGLIDYVNRLRVEEACRLLSTSDWSIARIAGEVGYDEIAYFSRRFRHETGQSAREYRKAATTGVNV